MSMLLTKRTMEGWPSSASYHAAAAGFSTRGDPSVTLCTTACTPGQPYVRNPNLAVRCHLSLHTAGLQAP